MATVNTPRVSGAVTASNTRRVSEQPVTTGELLLEGDYSGSLLLEGDMQQSGGDLILLEGDHTTNNITKRVQL